MYAPVVDTLLILILALKLNFSVSVNRALTFTSETAINLSALVKKKDCKHENMSCC